MNPSCMKPTCANFSIAKNVTFHGSTSLQFLIIFLTGNSVFQWQAEEYRIFTLYDTTKICILVYRFFQLWDVDWRMWKAVSIFCGYGILVGSDLSSYLILMNKQNWTTALRNCSAIGTTLLAVEYDDKDVCLSNLVRCNA
jgi:hypothetical protein